MRLYGGGNAHQLLLECLLNGDIESGQRPEVPHTVDDPERSSTELGKPEAHPLLLTLMETNVLHQSCTDIKSPAHLHTGVTIRVNFAVSLPTNLWNKYRQMASFPLISTMTKPIHNTVSESSG